MKKNLRLLIVTILLIALGFSITGGTTAQTQSLSLNESAVFPEGI
jgi:hypothetical protein